MVWGVMLTMTTPIDSNSGRDAISAFQFPKGKDIRKFPNKIVKYNQYLKKPSMKVHEF